MNTNPRCLTWTPVRRGAIYCSPACGGGCTWAAFQEATGNADALAKRIGGGWKPRVWENLGWHYSVTSPNNYVKMHPKVYPPDRRTRYLAFFGWPEGPGGNFTTNGTDFKKVLAAGLSEARAIARKAAKLVQEIKSAAMTPGGGTGGKET